MERGTSGTGSGRSEVSADGFEKKRPRGKPAERRKDTRPYKTTYQKPAFSANSWKMEIVRPCIRVNVSTRPPTSPAWNTPRHFVLLRDPGGRPRLHSPPRDDTRRPAINEQTRDAARANRRRPFSLRSSGLPLARAGITSTAVVMTREGRRGYGATITPRELRNDDAPRPAGAIPERRRHFAPCFAPRPKK